MTYVLDNWIKENGVTQTWLAAELGVAQGQVSDWCSGAVQLPPTRCNKISKITGLPLTELRPDVFGQ